MSRLNYRNAAPQSVSGMTLVEIVVVVAILLVLTSVLSFGIYNIYETSKQQVATLEINRMGTSITAYEVSHSAQLTEDDGLAALSDDGRAPTDPWHNPYEYDADAPVRSGFDILSTGKDGQTGGVGFAQDIRHSEL